MRRECLRRLLVICYAIGHSVTSLRKRYGIDDYGYMLARMNNFMKLCECVKLSTNQIFIDRYEKDMTVVQRVEIRHIFDGRKERSCQILCTVTSLLVKASRTLRSPVLRYSIRGPLSTAIGTAILKRG